MCNTIALGEDSAKPEELFSKATNRTEQKRLSAAVCAAYTRRVEAMARRMLATPQHRAEAVQAGMLGLLLALQAYEPARADCGNNRGRRGVAFWAFARFFVRDEMRKWVDRGVYWRPDTNRSKHPQRVAARNRARAASVFVMLDDGVDPADPETPETLFEAAELQFRVHEFAEDLNAFERAKFFSEKGCHHRTLIERARAALTKGS